MRTRYVSFSLAAGSYCIPVDQVLQILRRENLIEIPKAPPFVEGVLNLRGDIIPVVDLRARLEIPAATPGGIPAATPGGIPAATPGGIPAATPGGIPAATPGGIPAATPGGIPAATGERRPAADARKRRVIIARVGDRSYGLDVDEVREIVEIDDGGISADAGTLLGVRPDFIQGIARREDSLYMVLDLARVFASGRDVSSAIPGQG